MNSKKYDGLLIASFGGPEGIADVMPFLDNVLRGKNVPLERKKEVAHHYEMFGGVSPINAQNRELKNLVEAQLKEKKLDLPVFWGNRNWTPYFKDAIQEMKNHGVQHALVYITSAYGSYPGCRKYLEDIAEAKNEVDDAPTFERLPLFYNHPNFISVNVQNIRKELKKIPSQNLSETFLLFTAHSIPMAMSETSPYVEQLQSTCRKVADQVGIRDYKLVYQSRSGPPQVPWLAPDVCDELIRVKDAGKKNVIVSPIGFTSDHMEVIYDLDVEAKQKAEQLGLLFFRAKTAGSDPLMIDMIVDQVKQRLEGIAPMFICAPNCCQPRRP